MSALRDGIAAVPDLGGVYAVLRVDDGPPRFLGRNPGSHFNRKDPTVPMERLKKEWVDGAQTLYIGSARNLRDRIGRLIEFSDAGTDNSVFHWGGRLLWQVATSDEFEIVWKTLPPDQIRMLEQELVDEFVDGWGRMPFANLKRPTGR